MPLGEQALLERFAVQVRDLGAAGIECGQRFFSPNEVHRRSPLGSCLGEQQGPVVEVDGSEPVSLRDSRPVFEPLQAPCDHQMDHHGEILLEVDGDALPDAVDSGDCLPFDGGRRGVVGSEQRDAGDPQLLQLMADHPRAQGVQVRLDLRKLRHEKSQVASRKSQARRRPQTSHQYVPWVLCLVSCVSSEHVLFGRAYQVGGAAFPAQAQPAYDRGWDPARLAHHQVGGGGDLIHNGYLGDL